MNQGDRFKKARKFLEFSQKGISEKVGLSQNAISKIESGETSNPSYRYISYLKDNDISEEWLLEGTGEMKTKNNLVVEKSELEILKSENEKLKQENAEIKKKNSFLSQEMQGIKKELSDMKDRFINFQEMAFQEIALYKKKVNNVELGKVEASSSPANLFVSFRSSDKEEEKKLVA